MREELGMTIGARYSICLLLFFPGYTIFEIPSNMALVRFGVWKTMTFLICSWGLVVMGMGLVHSWVCFFVAVPTIVGPRCSQIFPRMLRSWNFPWGCLSH
jgi:hypothetical protein